MRSFKQYINETPWHDAEDYTSLFAPIMQDGKITNFDKLNRIFAETLALEPINKEDPKSSKKSTWVGKGVSRNAYLFPAIPKQQFSVDQQRILRAFGISSRGGIDTVIKVPMRRSEMQQQVNEVTMWDEENKKESALRKFLCPIIDRAQTMVMGATEPFIIQMPAVICLSKEYVMNPPTIPMLIEFLGMYPLYGANFDWQRFRDAMVSARNSGGTADGDIEKFKASLKIDNLYEDDPNSNYFAKYHKTDEQLNNALAWARVIEGLGDLHIGNIGMLKDKKKYRPVIIDYGLAR